VLWKGVKPGEPSWRESWGPGRPGWHIECSAHVGRYLGATVRHHGGGDDLIFPHPRCEIAQSEAASGETFARYWLAQRHGQHAGGRRCPSRCGNTLTIRDWSPRHDPAALRLFLLGTHYREPLEWAEERGADSARALERLWRPVDDATSTRPRRRRKDTPLPADLQAFRQRFLDAMV
jgi:cysteinyl-tRNA synthetase